ncbi:hypothetical protein AOXY_G37511 [Acipenser oxyrinchus oxyrinchus]|uniref:Integrase catalytic domain-containing protein n=1 Tax=Acipenser oxyrinchus oxyrinchus TaxID=40147 RepID=A0AAD8CE33_ACIOX|nr:hypothetical protein AOXY_G37511 [Acipenser oxyrinchus oxyrinchus]
MILIFNVKLFLKFCPECERKRPTVKAPTTYTPIQVNEPWELVGMDRIGKLSKTERGHEYICTVVDYLTKWAEAFPLQTKSAAVSDCIIKIFYRFGAPKRILTDQRREFKNEMNSILCKLLNIKRSLSAPYHPQTNGQVEKMNSTIQRFWSAYGLPIVIFNSRQ